jgi:hypothetical protein
MIRSGLVNQRRGGGFEKGYPGEYKPDNTTIVRPYVDTIDKGLGARSDISQVAPLAVSYDKIFGKTLSPDERMYIVREIEQGRQGQMEGIPLPERSEQPIVAEPVNPGAPAGSYPDSAIDIEDDYQSMGNDVVAYAPMVADELRGIGRGVRSR